MGIIEKTIKNLLIDNFDPTILDITNESSMHNVPKGSESHFKVVIVSNDFKDIKDIHRHQSVYKALQDVMQSIHALSIHTYDEVEYADNPNHIKSPNCVNKKNEN